MRGRALSNILKVACTQRPSDTLRIEIVHKLDKSWLRNLFYHCLALNVTNNRDGVCPGREGGQASDMVNYVDPFLYSEGISKA